MSCTDTRANLPEFVMDILPADTHKQIERHLVSCPGCRKEAEELREGLAGAALALPKAEPPPSLEDRVVTGLLEASGKWRVRKRRSVRVMAVAAMSAALLAAGSLTWGLAMRHQVLSLKSRASHATLTVQRLGMVVKELRANGKVFTAHLAPVNRLAGGGGAAMVVSVPNAPDAFVIQVIVPRSARGPFTAVLVGRTGERVGAGRLTLSSNAVYMLPTLFRQFQRNLGTIATVAVVGRNGAAVLQGVFHPYSA